MIDRLGRRFVMVGNDHKQELTDDQLYLIAADTSEPVSHILFQIGLDYATAEAEISISVPDLIQALEEFDIHAQTKAIR